MVPFPDGAREFCLPPGMHAVSGGHSASYGVDTRDFSFTTFKRSGKLLAQHDLFPRSVLHYTQRQQLDYKHRAVRYKYPVSVSPR